MKFPYFKKSLVSFLLGIGLTISCGQISSAQTADNAPAELKTLLEQIESAANEHNLNQVLAFYNTNFTNSDGINTDILSQSLNALWYRFPNLNYRTQLNSWEQNGNQIIVETLTTIQGTQILDGRLVWLNSTLTSRQYIENQQIIRQEILAEKTQLTSGENPPQVTVNLPERVKRGERFPFDVIVNEPLGNDLLLGSVIEERTTGNLYLNPSSFDLEILSAGGIFKWVKAPLVADQRWLSALLVRGDGMTLITQRVIIDE